MNTFQKQEKPKLMSTISSIEKKIVEDWRKEFIINDFKSLLFLGDAYNHYTQYALSRFSVPLTKKSFSNAFQVILHEEIDLNQIKIQSTSRLAFKGIQLKAEEIILN